MCLPIRTASIDVCCSSNVLEHVPRPWQLADEMVRVVRPGGTVVLSFTNWLSPHGGHETSPWHFLGGEYAARRYQRHHGSPPQNRFGQSLFAVSVVDSLRWAEASPLADLISAGPRYFPGWASGLLRVPVARELLSWNVLLVLRRR
jgi:SAM-dependent methyltransferase